jgi:hypothetical protein
MLHLAYKDSSNGTLPMGFRVFSSQGKQRKEKERKGPLIQGSTYLHNRQQSGLKKKNHTQIIQHECEMDHHFWLIAKDLPLLRIFGACLECKKREREPIGGEKKKLN